MLIGRPSVRELDRKLATAKMHVKAGRRRWANLNKVAGEVDYFQLDDISEVWDVIETVLDEIRSEDYTGSRPPQRSYEPEIRDCELFAFCWDSQCLKERMYLKYYPRTILFTFHFILVVLRAAIPAVTQLGDVE